MRLFENIKPLNDLTVGLAENKDEIREAQILRYQMLLLEFDESKDKNGIDESPYDEFCDHIIVKDNTNNKIVGTYRLLSNLILPEGKEFISEPEFNIDKLKNSGKNILELSRAVVHKDYRNGFVLRLLWQAIIAYSKMNNIKYMFGTASFHGVDYTKYKHAFSSIYYNNLADEEILCYAKEPCMDMRILSKEEIDENLARHETQPLVRGYFAIGSKVGSGIFFDYEFNSTDIMMIFDMDNLNKKYLSRMFGVEL